MTLKLGYILVIMISCTQVASWTIDLPEIRKYLFEKNEKDRSDYDLSNDKTFYDNIDGNRLSQERQVLKVVRDGSAYVEGLRRSVERYIEFLENCTSNNYYAKINTTWLPQHEMPDITNVTFQALLINGTRNANTTWQIGKPGNISRGAGAAELCGNITRAGERVRRLAQLAVWTTKRLQDLAYAEEYQYDNGKEEDELIFKLAWLLDRLAAVTGYVPEPKTFEGEEPRETTTTIPYPPPPMIPIPVPDDIKRNMMTCLKMESPIPATVRCAFPLPLPPEMQELLNITDTTSISQPLTENVGVLPLDLNPDQSSLELLTATDTFTPFAKTAPRNVQKRFSNWLYTKTSSPRELSDSTSIKTVKKRSINKQPLIHFMKYKAWVNSNPTNSINKYDNDNFEVKNHLTAVKSVHKRSLPPKKNFRIPTIPMPDLSRYVKHKSGVHYRRDRLVVEKIKNMLERMHRQKVLIHKNKLPNPFRNLKKRSLKYEKMYLPRISGNPKQDISYYIKNKEGIEYNPSVLQAAQARAGLQQHFMTGNILVITRYGSNYNPAIPLPFYFGLLKGLADS